MYEYILLSVTDLELERNIRKLLKTFNFCVLSKLSALTDSGWDSEIIKPQNC